ncbi:MULTISPECIES: YlmC/YmxH family sporulation protein [Oscillospiraceae]|uniref:YlmC/YmxH family sporulation protein n=1 Tax=Lawsonibacter faecis TaxID=2763052 RepID=A0A8J6M724_9FIRM|nr:MULTISPECIES: YlmC/YmxH family sporulation protein [Oscillospiraceae]MTQ97244.1 YlmC/YmxH family sporulation protein [Pseudoflavonifractor sp. BIOML-A16]MTR05283.1 YlmC/YmxH family sporulation protein [Pseudoflavonifractor sp. BIOML-A15]MTR31549.1 YlmC/YmxH family sporulation protein [Pseudoflavonifractor sp. BIOML-A14]MTR72235.1 YlmC/YmxH family sporulation protein [Pseudoflavonifractor sp. BIOML-A18]MTS63025.1 YlmC/YmxH family sporulation protein [Pseudoflavonifractor sp. BIOML-A5]MTS706
MESRIADLRCKEIINVSDGCRFGYVGDVEVDLESGRVTALVVPGRLRLFGLLGREEDRIFPWESVRRFGEDIILVEADAAQVRRAERRRRREA